MKIFNMTFTIQSTETQPFYKFIYTQKNILKTETREKALRKSSLILLETHAHF